MQFQFYHFKVWQHDNHFTITHTFQTALIHVFSFPQLHLLYGDIFSCLQNDQSAEKNYFFMSIAWISELSFCHVSININKNKINQIYVTSENMNPFKTKTEIFRKSPTTYMLYNYQDCNWYHASLIKHVKLCHF